MVADEAVPKEWQPDDMDTDALGYDLPQKMIMLQKMMIMEMMFRERMMVAWMTNYKKKKNVYIFFIFYCLHILVQ